jgi:hypothetical protein
MAVLRDASQTVLQGGVLRIWLNAFRGITRSSMTSLACRVSKNLMAGSPWWQRHRFFLPFSASSSPSTFF